MVPRQTLCQVEDKRPGSRMSTTAWLSNFGNQNCEKLLDEHELALIRLKNLVKNAKSKTPDQRPLLNYSPFFKLYYSKSQGSCYPPFTKLL